MLKPNYYVLVLLLFVLIIPLLFYLNNLSVNNILKENYGEDGSIVNYAGQCQHRSRKRNTDPITYRCVANP
jgi:hypothetical protein